MRWNFTEMKASRGSSRCMMAARSNSAPSSVGTSFMLWTARSMRPSASASSISLVNIPLVPTLARATSRILSPVVLMISISTTCPCSPRSAATWLACHNASCEPREPMRRLAMGLLFGLSAVEVEIEDAADHLVDGSSLGMRRGRLERGDRRMQELVDDAAGHGFDGGFLLGGDFSQPPAVAVDLRLAD